MFLPVASGKRTITPRDGRRGTRALQALASGPAALVAAQVAAWACAAIVLLAFLVRISCGERVDADGASIALQGWDFIHGHVVMHGWLPGDATYYGFEVPILGVTELVFGLGAGAAHIASALAYVIVAGLAVALAVTGARGTARAARTGVVIAVMTAPLLTATMVWTLLEEPDHPGTAVFILLPALLADRLPGRRLIPPLVCLILCAGQVSDATVKYVVVPALVVVGASRMLRRSPATPRRTSDAAIAVAALASIPLEYAVHAVLLRMGGYLAVSPQNKISAPGRWPGHAAATWQVVRYLFGASGTPYTSLGYAGAAFGMVCLAAAIVGLVKVGWTWRRASWADQLLAVTIVGIVLAYAFSARADLNGNHEISEILPCGAVLAARALVPSAITQGRRALAALAATAVAVALPLAVAASRPVAGPALGPAPGDPSSAPTAPLTGWLEAHGFSYGLSDYWSSSTVTVQSGGQVQLRPVTMVRGASSPFYIPHVPYWETNSLWYDASRHDATFVAARDGQNAPAMYERLFGKPVATYRVSVWTILDYQRNLLTGLPPMLGLGVGPKS